MFPAALGTLRIARRLIAMAGLLVVAVFLFNIWKLVGACNPWPRRFLSGIAAIAGVRIQIMGKPASGQLLILANHVSWIDIPALASVTGTGFVAHDGLASVPLLKWLCEMNETIFISRDDLGSVGAQIEILRSALVGKNIVTLFPEGTTSDGSAVLPFKSSLLAALNQTQQIQAVQHVRTVQPVWLDYGPQTSAIAWVDKESGVDNFKRILARGQCVDLTIHFLEPLAAPALANRKTMANAAREAIMQAMAAPPARMEQP